MTIDDAKEGKSAVQPQSSEDPPMINNGNYFQMLRMSDPPDETGRFNRSMGRGSELMNDPESMRRTAQFGSIGDPESMRKIGAFGSPEDPESIRKSAAFGGQDGPESTSKSGAFAG